MREDGALLLDAATLLRDNGGAAGAVLRLFEMLMDKLRCGECDGCWGNSYCERPRLPQCLSQSEYRALKDKRNKIAHPRSAADLQLSEADVNWYIQALWCARHACHHSDATCAHTNGVWGSTRPQQQDGGQWEGPQEGQWEVAQEVERHVPQQQHVIAMWGVDNAMWGVDNAQHETRREEAMWGAGNADYDARREEVERERQERQRFARLRVSTHGGRGAVPQEGQYQVPQHGGMWGAGSAQQVAVREETEGPARLPAADARGRSGGSWARVPVEALFGNVRADSSAIVRRCACVCVCVCVCVCYTQEHKRCCA